MILLKASVNLKTVFLKTINTMGENVKWTEIFIINNNDVVLAGSGRSLFFDFDNKRAYSNVVELPINEDKAQPIVQNALLENILNMILYVFGKWGGIKGLKVEKDYEQLNRLINKILEEIDIESDLTADYFRFFKGGVRITYEEVVQLILDKSKPEENTSPTAETEENNQPANSEETNEDGSKKQEDDVNKYKLGLWHNMHWTAGNFSFIKKELSEKEDGNSRLGNDFYMVSYKCPTCGENLYMVIYPTGKEFRIETDLQAVYMARAYTCSACYSFYTPKPHTLIMEGDVFYLTFEDDSEAYADYLELLGQDGKRTSNYNFNEYESDYNQSEKEPQLPLEDICAEIDTMEDSEVVRLKDKIDSGFFPQISVEKYSQQVASELQDRQDPKKKKERKKKEKARKNKEKSDKKKNDKEQKNITKNKIANSDIKKNNLDNSNITKNSIDKNPIDNSDTENKNAQENNTKNNSLDNNNTAKKDIAKNNAAKSGFMNDSIVNNKIEDSNTKNNHTANKVLDQHNLLKNSNDSVYHKKAEMNKIAKDNNTAKKALNENTTSSANSAESKSDISSAKKSDPLPSSENKSHLLDILNSLINGAHDNFLSVVEKLSLTQLGDLKSMILSSLDFAENDKKNFLDIIEKALFKGKEKELVQKITSGKEKKYADLLPLLNEIKDCDCAESVKEPMIKTLMDLLKRNGQKELDQLVASIPDNINKKQYQQFLDLLNQYRQIGNSSSIKLLEEKRDYAEKQEISAFVKRTNAKDRTSLFDTYSKLKSQDFNDRNVTPFLEKIHDRIYSLDEAALKKICPDPADITFDEGLEAYEEISSENFLPELKSNMLGLIDKRLMKLKTDECELLVKKFSKDMNWTQEDYSRIYFYDARKMMKGDTEEEGSQIIISALNSYAAERGKYEFPILICDTSHFSNGKSGFVLTPDHIFYNSLTSSGAVSVMDIDSVTAGTGLFKKNVYVHTPNAGKVKISNSHKLKNSKSFTTAFIDFILYLKEKPESRNVFYMAKEKHAVKCCYRCGYVYREGNICPKCGSKFNE